MFRSSKVIDQNLPFYCTLERVAAARIWCGLNVRAWGEHGARTGCRAGLVSVHPRQVPFLVQAYLWEFRPGVRWKEHHVSLVLWTSSPVLYQDQQPELFLPLWTHPLLPPWIKPSSRVRKESDRDLKRPNLEVRTSCSWNERNKAKERDCFRRGAERREVWTLNKMNEVGFNLNRGDTFLLLALIVHKTLHCFLLPFLCSLHF